MSNKQLLIAIGLLLLAMTVPAALADTQFVVGYTGSYGASDTYTTSLLPNRTTIVNTTYTTARTGNTQAVSSVTFYYNDSSSWTSTEQIYPGTYTVLNPYLNKAVDRVSWTVYRANPPEYQVQLVVTDFWGRDSVPTLTVQANDTVTGQGLLNFCVSASGSGLENSTCSAASDTTSLLNPSATGYNSKTYLQNYQEAVADGLQSKFNTTKIFSNGTANFLWVPWMSSSSACGPLQNKTYGNCTNVNSTKSVMVTDELSIACLMISMSNRTDEIEACYNTFGRIKSAYGEAQAWVACADYSDTTNPQIWRVSSDSASDATARIGQLLYHASVNPAVTTANQTKYRTLANQLAADHLTYETVTGSWSTPYGTVTRLPLTGGNCASVGVSTCAGDYYIGYYHDTIKFMLAAYAQTNNANYLTAAENYVRAYLSVSLQNDTDGDGFGVGPKLFDYKTTGTLGHQDTTAYVWDDSDAPRDRTCDVLRLANLTTGGLSGVWANLSTYCLKKSQSNTYTSTTSTLQYRYDGASYSSPSGGYYTNGLGALDHTYYNTSTFDDKLNEAWGHYSWSTDTYDSTSCGNTLTYRGMRPLEALAVGIGLQDDVYLGNQSCSGTSLSTTIGGLTVLLNSPTNASTTSSTSQTISVTVTNNNVTSTGGTPDTTPVECGFSSGSDACEFDLTPVSGVLNVSTSTTADLSLTDYTWFNASMMIYCPANSVGLKIYPSIGTGRDNWLWECSGVDCHVKNENNYGLDLAGFPIDAWTSVWMAFNRSSNTSTIMWTGKSGGPSTTGAGTFDIITTSDGFQFDSPYSGDDCAIDNFNITVLSGEAPTSGSTAGNSSMNVSFYAGNGTLLGTNNNVLNATTTTLAWTTTTSQAYPWYVRVRSENEDRWFGNYTFTVAGTASLPNVCTTNGTIAYWNVTNGDYTLTLYNVSNSQYFNQTSNVTVSLTSNGTQWVNVTFNTYQALLNLQAYRLWLNTSIASFFVRNNLVTNTTTSGSLFIPASNGTNNVFVNVTGNFTKNITCTVTSPLATVACNATDIHDARLIVNATFQGTLVTNWTINVTNSSLGTPLYTQNTTNGTFDLPALLGYAYYTTFYSTTYVGQNTTINATATPTYYTFPVRYSQSLTIRIKDELTDNNVTQNFSVQFVDGVAENFTIVNGSGTVVLSLPAYYTIRYSAPSYNERERFTTITTQSAQEILLYAINSSVSTQIAVTVRDTSGAPVGNATVTLLRYFFNCNCYLPVEERSTAYTGQTAFYVQVAEGHYKWSVNYLGTNYFLSSTPETINEDSRTFIIDRGQQFYESITRVSGMSHNLVYNRETGGVSFTWSDPSGIVTQGCLTVKYLDGVDYAYYPPVCADGAIGSVVVTVDDPENTRYFASGTVATSTEFSDHVLSAIWLDPLFTSEYGVLGQFLGVGFIITVALIFSFSAVAVIIGTIGSALIITLLGLTPLMTNAFAALAAIGLGFAIYVMRN